MSSLYEPPALPWMGAAANTLGGNYGPTSNPFYNVANQFLPRNLNDIIRWSRYITMQSPVTTEVIRKLSTYPVTDFVIDTESEVVKKKYQEIFESFSLKQTLHNVGFEFHSVGNVFISIYFPIQRTLTCPHCNSNFNAKTADFTSFKRYQFIGTCPVCQQANTTFVRSDTKSLNVADMNIVKWDPTDIAVNYNPITGEYRYYYDIPRDIVARVQKGDKLFVNSVPWSLIEAIKDNKKYEFDKNSIYHLKNISASQQVNGLAIPPLVTLFSLVFYQASLRKANESIANDFMAPLRVVYPAPQTANSDPVVAISMRSFVSNMQNAFASHRRDKSHVVFAPVPIGYQAVSGEGKTLLVSQEIMQAEESILLSMGVSKELLSGTTNWTSSTVGLRLLQNTLNCYVDQIEGLLTWIMNRASTYLGLAVCRVSLVPFKLTDDDNLRQILLNLVAEGKVSASTLLESYGFDYEEELEKISNEQVSLAKHQVTTKFKVEQATFMASKSTSDKFDKEGEYREALTRAQAQAEQLAQSDESIVRQTLNMLKTTDYPQYLLVAKLVQDIKRGALHAQPATPGPENEEIGPPVGDPNDPNVDPNAPPGAEGGEGGPPGEGKGGGDSKPPAKDRPKTSSQPK